MRKTSFLDLYFNSVSIAHCSLIGYIYIGIIIIIILTASMSFLFLPIWLWFILMLVQILEIALICIIITFCIAFIIDLTRLFIPKKENNDKSFEIPNVIFVFIRVINVISVVFFIIFTLLLFNYLDYAKNITPSEIQADIRTKNVNEMAVKPNKDYNEYIQ